MAAELLIGRVVQKQLAKISVTKDDLLGAIESDKPKHQKQDASRRECEAEARRVLSDWFANEVEKAVKQAGALPSGALTLYEGLSVQWLDVEFDPTQRRWEGGKQMPRRVPKDFRRSKAPHLYTV